MKRNEIHIRDPFILPWEGKYYMYGSRVGDNYGEHTWGDQFGFDVYVSDDLEDWSEPKGIFDRNPDFWGTKDFWAPEVHYYKGKFYLFASFKAEDRCRGTHILVSDAPDGRFAPVSKDPATPMDWECLDGTLYVDKKGVPHIVFCHEWLQVGNGTMCECTLSEDLTHAVTEPRVLWCAQDFGSVASVSMHGKIGYVTDGPFFFRCDNGELVSIWSSFDENGYVELIARSNNGDIDGEWSVDQVPLSGKDGGHGMIFTSFEGKTYFVMHKPNKSPFERAVITELKQNGGNLSLDE